MIVQRTTRFGGFPAIRIGNLYFVWRFSYWRLSAGKARGIDTGSGMRDVFYVNIGKTMLCLEH
jgi:hypothetical protein